MPPAQVNPALSPELNNIVLRAMVKFPDGRFQTADEFRNALKSLSQPQAQQVAQPVPTAQGFAPVAVAPAASVTSGGKSHRGLWIGLGAVAAVLALVAAATLLPHIFATHASQKPAVVDTPTPAATPDASSAAQPSAVTPDTAQQPNPLSTATPQTAAPAVDQPSAATAMRPAASKTRPAAAASTQTQAAGAVVPPQPAGPSPLEIRQTRDRLMNLGAKADAARAGVQQIRSQQQAQGFDIRGDILASMNRMNNFLGEADHALSQNDLQAANDYMDRADKEVSTLETFLGR
jgi:serine/threonine-protein kinase